MVEACLWVSLRRKGSGLCRCYRIWLTSTRCLWIWHTISAKTWTMHLLTQCGNHMSPSWLCLLHHFVCQVDLWQWRWYTPIPASLIMFVLRGQTPFMNLVPPPCLCFAICNELGFKNYPVWFGQSILNYRRHLSVNSNSSKNDELNRLDPRLLDLWCKLNSFASMCSSAFL